MLEFKQANKAHADLLLGLIKSLAISEGFPDELTVTKKDLIENLLNSYSNAKACLVYKNHELCGFFVYYTTFSTTTGRRGLHLDDLYVIEKFQGQGIGTAIMEHLRTIAATMGCPRFEWWCLETNEKAAGFYEGLGARKLDEIRTYRMDLR